jgi:multiple sugar transport system permease protein
MSASVRRVDLVAEPAARRLARLNQLDIAGLVSTFGTLIGAIVWAFPLYWGLITTFKHEYEIVRPGVQLWPEHFTFEN